MTYLKRSRCFLLAMLWLPGLVEAQHANYAAAEKYDVPGLRDKVGTLTVLPFFFRNNDRFWFIYEDKNGRNYYYVDPATRKKQLLYDRKAIETALFKLRKENIDTALISYNAPFELSGKQQTVRISYKKQSYAWNFYTHQLAPDSKEEGKPVYPKGITGMASPDKKWQLISRAHNLYLQQVGDTIETTLSRDAARYYSFGVNEDDTSASRSIPADAVWLADSRRFYLVREDNRKVGTLSVVNSLAWPRPRLETYKYQLPGDKDVTQFELFAGDVTTGKLVKIKTDKWKDQELEVVKTKVMSDEIYFLRKKRTRDEIELCAGNMKTGDVRVIVRETSKPYLNEDLFNVQVINNGKDIVWWSDRTGWGQYYRYGNDGTLKNAITRGSWTAGRILYIDTPGNVFYMYGYGKEAGRNPYYAHVYKVPLDGSKDELLTPENATHAVYFSPSGHYIVDNFSTINTPPRTMLRDNNGRLIMEVAQPNLEKLYAYGWRPPEPFMVKAADSVTDLYGIMWKPFDFDSTKKYPVISQVYPGPQIETVWPDFTIFDKYNNAPLAQTGCIVVCMGHRGGSPYREKQYAAFQYGNLRDAPLADDKYGLEQLGQRYPFIDINRVGIFGHSGGAMMAVAAICTYPGFYKVAVASSGNHDNNIYNRTWGETFQGVTEKTDTLTGGKTVTSFPFKTPINQTLAKNLQGHLLLVTGETDANVHPGNTYRMADALINAGKDFDMLVLPGQSHHYEGVYKTFFEKKLRSYFAKYLIENNDTPVEK
ncbi:peptidase S9 [Niastella koreensis]|uniref:Peptidase S9B dipeptidylpeptidase IV domain protein n=2 Tax=Niastella koreensis TaxID=354356 RepID=G8TKM7_NIAKG|nr:DPP IV N-terminal domain-containing protein [Niastella koreensis]AEV98701.1 peptidase S9B dipeptidylpeptidase IV domain protein [Niastella koreensis GR20-10]OQP44942.1 peptidase S9 [Niastella koreensis]